MTGITSEATDATQLETILAAAAAARRPLAALSADERRALMTACADALAGAVTELVALAQSETHLPEARLRGEIDRTRFQFELYGEAIEAVIPVEVEPADADARPAPRPELRRTARPIGPVLVFAASNFPFAFSVAGTDTASALAAGCPVVVKAHPGHPRTSEAVAALLTRALRDAGAPVGTFAMISGVDAGVAALKDPRICAAAFTGSEAGGRFLHDIAAARPVPIPFYGELGSLNPVLVGPSAALARGAEVLDGFVASFTLGAGQFCTKPGLLFWPADVDLPGALGNALTAISLHPMLNGTIEAAHRRTLAALVDAPGMKVLADGGPGSATILQTSAAALAAHPAETLVECFGPTAVVVTYTGDDDLAAALEAMDGSLTASIHADPGDDGWVSAHLPALEELAGRIVWGQWPTGVAVAMAQHHGGPYPATTAPLHTSVGTHAIDRFLRPITYQNMPERFVPEQLRTQAGQGQKRRDSASS